MHPMMILAICFYHLGGTAITLAKFGMPVNYFGCVGDDSKGEFLRNIMQKLQINTAGISKSSIPTSATIINVRANGDRPCLHEKGASDELILSPEDFKDIAQNASILHVGGIGLSAGCSNETSVKRLLQSLNHLNMGIITVRFQIVRLEVHFLDPYISGFRFNCSS